MQVINISLVWLSSLWFDAYFLVVVWLSSYVDKHENIFPTFSVFPCLYSFFHSPDAWTIRFCLFIKLGVGKKEFSLLWIYNMPIFEWHVHVTKQIRVIWDGENSIYWNSWRRNIFGRNSVGTLMELGMVAKWSSLLCRYTKKITTQCGKCDGKGLQKHLREYKKKTLDQFQGLGDSVSEPCMPGS